MKDQVAWRQFSRVALLDKQIDLAIRIFRQLGDVAMIWALEELLYVEDQQVLGLVGKINTKLFSELIK